MLVVLVAGAIGVAASPRFQATTAARPSPSSLLVIEHPTPAPTPTPTPSPTSTPVVTPSGTVTFTVPVYKQLRNLDSPTGYMTGQVPVAAPYYAQPAHPQSNTGAYPTYQPPQG